MAFYIQPPKGDIKVAQLENWALQRLQFLVNIFHCNGDMEAVKQLMESTSSVEQSDCLIEGTTKDAVSHFILRLACSDDSLLSKVFVESETVLFLHRFTSLNEEELVRYLGSVRHFQRQLTKHLESIRNCSEADNVKFPTFVKNFSQFFKMLTETFDWRSLIHHYFLKSQKHFVRLPFEFVLEMVSKREVILNRGNAFIPCIYLPQLLRWFFQNWLVYGMHLARSQHGQIIQDSRMERLFAKCRDAIHRCCHNYSARHQTKIFGSLTVSDVQRLSEGFPPCMIQLQESLRQNHRLKHYSRITYMLFLKDLGLPVSEALSFWRHEYMQPFPSSSSYHGCRHLWQKEERRLTYSIHHLYGLNGSRQKYSSHTCTYIQNHDWGPAEEASCPFKNFEGSKVQKYLTSGLFSNDVSTGILEYVERNQYNSACTAYLRARVQQKQNSVIVHDETIGSKQRFTNGENVSNFSAKAGVQTNVELICDDNLVLLDSSENLRRNDIKTETVEEGILNCKRASVFESSSFKRCRTTELRSFSHDPSFISIQERNGTNFLKKTLIASCVSLPSCEETGALLDEPLPDSGYGELSCLSLTDANVHVEDCGSSKNSLIQEPVADISKCFVSQSCTNKCNMTKSLFNPVVEKTGLDSCISKPSEADFSGELKASSKTIPFRRHEACRSRNGCQDVKVCNVNDVSEKSCCSSNMEQQETSCKKSQRPQLSSYEESAYVLKRPIRKPIEFFQSYNELIEEFRKASKICQS